MLYLLHYIIFIFTAPIFYDITKKMDLNYINHLVGLGYNSVDGFGYYKHHTKRENWTTAVRICEEEGAHLWIVDSIDEDNKVRNIIWKPNYRSFRSLTGAHYVQGKWITLLSEY